MEMVELIGVLDWIDGLEWDPHVRGFLAVFAGFCVWMGSIWIIVSSNSGVRLGTLLSLAGLFAWLTIMGSIWWLYGIGWAGDAPIWEEVEIVEGTDAEGHLTFAALDEANLLRTESLPSAHDAPDSKRVGNGLTQAVLLGNLEIRHGAGLIAPDLKRSDDKIRTVHRRAAVGMRRHSRPSTGGLNHLAHHHLAFRKAHGINVHQRKVAIGQSRRQESVAHDILHENRGTCSNKGDFRHLTAPRVRPAIKCLCIRKNMATGGKAATMEPALIR